ncbi:MAG TPA: hypothetical protein VK968_06585 [Roseimicrobium sp.]|nr:hypothetical protein [Roseimicrobium sp.]
MKNATALAIHALNHKDTSAITFDLESGRYALVDSWEDARHAAEGEDWDRFITDVHNGIFIQSLQPRLKRLGITMANEREAIGTALAPAVRDVRLAGWSEIPRFPFEMLLHDCCSEIEFRDVLEPVFFFPLVFPVLVSGHFPCGWEGESIPHGWNPHGPEDLPKGRLMVHRVT